MLRAAKHLDAHRERPFAALRVTRKAILKCVLTTPLRGYCYAVSQNERKYPDRPFAALRACPERSEWGDKKGPAAFVQALTAMLGVLTLGVLAGLLIAVALSLLILIYQASRPSVAVLGKVPGKQAYGNIEQYPENEAIPGLLMVRPDVQFFFAKTTQFRNRVRDLLRTTDPSPSAVLDIDSIEMLTDLQTELKAEGIELLLSVRAPVRDLLQRSGLIERIGKQHIYLSVEEGVRVFQESS